MTDHEKLAQAIKDLKEHNRQKAEAARKARINMPSGDIRAAARHNGQFDRIYPEAGAECS